MAQRSRFWDGTSVGDAVVAPYDAGTEFSEVMTAVAGLASDPNKGGLVSSISVSMFAPGTMRIGAFEALVYGAWYQNDANVDFVVATPAAATRIDTVVLRKDWAAQTVRMFVLPGTEGGSAPPLVQTPGVTWDVPIASLSTTTGGVTTITGTSSRADFWYRTAPDAIRTDNGFVGIGYSTPSAIGPAGHSTLAIGYGGTIVVQQASGVNPNFMLTNNTQWVGGNAQPLVGGYPAMRVSMYNGALEYSFAPAVALGVNQTYFTILHMSQAGGLQLGAWQAADASILFRTGSAVNEARYVMGVQYQQDLTIQDIVRNGPVVLRIGRTTNTMTLAPNSGQPALAWAQGALGGESNPRLYSTGAQNVELYGNGGYVHPSVDGLIHLGAGSLRWQTVFATTPAINTSSREVKQNIVPLDTQVAMDAVRATEAVTFEYITPNPVRGAFELPEDIEQAEQVLLFRMREAKLISDSRKQSGFIAEQADPLFLVGEGQASAGNSVGVLLAAMQNIDARLRANGM